MLKIVRGAGGYAYGMGEPVTIDNTVFIPGEKDENGDDIEKVSAEELRRRAEEEKAAEERRINEAVEARVSRILAERAAMMEQERSGIMENARVEAARITSDAKTATMMVMEKAQQECEELKEQAKKEGFEEGFEEGKAESLDKYRKYVDAVGRLLSEINSRKEAYYISNEEEMRETLFEMVKKVVRIELKTNPQVIDNIIAEAAKNFRNSDYLKITLAAEDITERFRTDEKLVKDIIPFIPEIEIKFDEEAEEGTVIEDNGSEIVDAGVPTQLEFLREILKTTRGEPLDDEDQISFDDGDEDEVFAEEVDREMLETVPDEVMEELQEEPEPPKKPKKRTKK